MSKRSPARALKGWASQGSELACVNLRGRKEVLKQKSWNTRKVWWAPILTRGKLHVMLFDEEFPGEPPAGAGALAQKLLAAINVRFPNATAKPSCVFVDRGKAFYHPASGKITPTFKKALGECGFTAFWGDDASVQAGPRNGGVLAPRAPGADTPKRLLAGDHRGFRDPPACVLRRCQRPSGGGGLVQGLPQEGAVAAGPGGRAPEGVSAPVRPNWATPCILHTAGGKKAPRQIVPIIGNCLSQTVTNSSTIWRPPYSRGDE